MNPGVISISRVVGFFCCLFSILSPLPCSAQVAVGIVSDSASGNAIRGAMALLLDENGEVASGFLTDEGGRFLLRAPGGGSYKIRLERVGFRVLETTPFPLLPGESQEFHLTISPSPLELDGLVLEGTEECRLRPNEGLRVAEVWEEARKALANQEWTSRGGFLRYEVLRYRRALDLQGRPVEEMGRRSARLLGETPVRSLPAGDLAALGYIRPLPEGGYDYFGPDASALLSDAFLDTHCFRLRDDPAQPELVGLAFEPVKDRQVPDIQGTFWLDRSTARLKLLEFGYSWTPWPEAQGLARGRVEFKTLPAGAWVIHRWWIRMPIMVVDYTVRRMGGDGLRADGLMEEGGQVTRISLLDGGRVVDGANRLAFISGSPPPGSRAAAAAGGKPDKHTAGREGR